MKTLHLYLIRQALATLVMTVLVFTFVLLLGNALKEILTLLVERQATLPVVIKAVGLLIPYVLVFALPMGMLCATLLLFGRLSADLELTAMRANGIGLIPLIWPLLALAALLTGLSAWMNLEIAPKSRVAYKKLIAEALVSADAIPLRENQYNSDLPGGYTIYVGKIRGDLLENLEVFQSNQATQLWIKAESARVVRDTANQTITVTLVNSFGTRIVGTNWFPVQNVGDYELPPFQLKGRDRPDNFGISNMTFSELRQKLADLERQTASSAAWTNTTSAVLREQAKSIDAMRRDLTMPVKLQMHRQLSFSFACIGFTLIGIPLGIRAHRRETSVGIALAVLLVAVYYSFFIVGEALETRAELAPHLIVWLPNFLFQIVGGALLWRASRR